jgi:L-alanine-DL-glutamate epimerase-like enolase superfamily enzyme
MYEEPSRSPVRAAIITAVEVHVLSGPAPTPPPGDLQRQVNAVSIYDAHRPAYRRTAPAPQAGLMRSRYIRIGTNIGVDGLYGPIDPEVTWAVLEQVRPALIGSDALATTVTWDRLERLDRHARHGHLKMAISAVDNALWDIRGKVYSAPVWQLLGGSARERIPAYLSTLGTSLDLDNVREVAAAAKAEGFAGQKWFLGDGPADGGDGLLRNVAIATTVREAIGFEADMMFDVFQGWDLAYARAWTKRVEGLLPTWLEEPFAPNRYNAFVELRRSTSVPISAGEHVYDRNELLPYLTDGVLAAIQCDPEWCGGVTELVRMCAIADLFSVPVIPHGHGLHAAIHVVASQSPAVCPKAEYLGRTMPNRHHFEIDPPTPVDGSFALPNVAGFGIRLDDAKIEGRELLQYA